MIVRNISYRDRRGILVIYLDYNFYFFKDNPRKWLLDIIQRDNLSQNIPESFIYYLQKIGILLKKSNETK